MARLPRYVLPGQPQHVIQRGNNREPIFAQAADYAFYMEKLKLACEQQACVIHAYVLMTNHVQVIDSKLRLRNSQSARRHPSLAAEIENPRRTGQMLKSIESDPIAATLSRRTDVPKSRK
jgi:hypothetical protein